MKKAFYILLLLFTALISCKKSSTSDQFTGVRLKYRYILNNQNKDLFDANVHRITAYVFDQDSLFYGSYDGTGEGLNSSYIMNIQLNVGKYTIIAWGGENEWTYQVGEITNPQQHIFRPSLIKGKTTLSNFRIKLDNYKENADQLYLTDKPADLYYGILNNLEVHPSSVATIANIDLIKNTNTITVTVQGLEHLPSYKAAEKISLINIYCVAKNGLYTYNNTIAETARSIIYFPPQNILRQTTISVELTILRLIMGESLRLVIHDPISNLNLVDNDIIDQIIQSPQYNSQLDLDKEDSYQFNLAIDKELNVKTYINGWEVVNITPDVK